MKSLVVSSFATVRNFIVFAAEFHSLFCLCVMFCLSLCPSLVLFKFGYRSRGSARRDAYQMKGAVVGCH